LKILFTLSKNILIDQELTLNLLDYKPYLADTDTMIILHGDNTTQSRAKLAELIQSAKQKNQEVTRLETKKLTLAELDTTLGSSSLFGTNKLIIVEELHSLPNSNKKKDLIKLLSKHSGSEDVVLWEKRALTATMLKKFPQAKAQAFKTSNQVFKWLDSLSGKTGNLKNKHSLLTEALNSDGEYFCFLMLLRQVRLLLQAKDSGKIKGPPFMISKLKSQASSFSLPQLLQLHQRLLQMDYSHKTSNTQLSLAQDLDLLLLGM